MFICSSRSSSANRSSMRRRNSSSRARSAARRSACAQAGGSGWAASEILAQAHPALQTQHATFKPEKPAQRCTRLEPLLRFVGLHHLSARGFLVAALLCSGSACPLGFQLRAQQVQQGLLLLPRRLLLLLLALQDLVGSGRGMENRKMRGYTVRALSTTSPPRLLASIQALLPTPHVPHSQPALTCPAPRAC
jgi:hypothetical protein